MIESDIKRATAVDDRNDFTRKMDGANECLCDLERSVESLLYRLAPVLGEYDPKVCDELIKSVEPSSDFDRRMCDLVDYTCRIKVKVDDATDRLVI